MPAPTENDWISFRSMPFGTKVDVLYAYTCQNYNMEEVASMVGFDGTWSVSVITRGYGFDRPRAGRFSRLGATKEDIEAFVRAYPNGCSFDGGATMEAFLKKRIAERKRKESASRNQNINNQNVNSQNINNQNGMQNRAVSTQSNYVEDDFDDMQYLESPGQGMTGTRFDGKILVAIVAVIALIFFRDKLLSLTLGVLPYIIILAMIGLAVKVILGGGIGSGRRRRRPSGGSSGGRIHFEPSVSGILFCVFMVWWGIAGIQNGGSVILGGVLCLIGLAMVFKFN